ncbi:MAG: hypothetical protein ACYSWQ_21250 [Planctomycetota bacterium]|jgi:hypothetical protein
MKPEDKIRSLIDKSDAVADLKTDKRILGDALEHMELKAPKQPVPGRSKIWRTIMKGKTAKLAAAAVVLIGVLVLTRVFVGTNKSVVLAGVLERVEQTQAYMFKIDMTMTESTNPERPPVVQRIKGTIIVSNEYGTKSEMHEKWEVDRDITNADTGKTTTELTYIRPKQKLVVFIEPGQKKYRRTELDEDSLARIKKRKNDPREMLKRMLECEYAEMGRTVLNGIEVEGFETTDPKWTMDMTKDYEDARVELWVDVETWLPVLWKADTTIGEQASLHTVVYDFQWDIPVVASDFEPVIPEDYTSMRDDSRMPDDKILSMTEEAALRDLKLFADIWGRYPKKAYTDSRMAELLAFRARRGTDDLDRKVKEAMEQIAERQDGTKAEVTSTREMIGFVPALAMFHVMLLGDEKEPAYYGETVGPDDVDAVLMRWKVSDDQYRVVFGDLSIGDVTAEDLAALETP